MMDRFLTDGYVCLSWDWLSIPFLGLLSIRPFVRSCGHMSSVTCRELE